MNWLDVQNMRQIGTPVPSPDGRSVLYTLSVPDWKEARRQTDIYLVSAQQGVSSTRRLTYSTDKSETAPQWSQDGQFFLFLSDRDAPSAAARVSRAVTLPTSGPGAPYFPAAVGGGTGGPTSQLYLMRPDGGEARKITGAKDGVTTYAFSKDGRWLVYRSGVAAQEQLYAIPVAGLAAGDSVRPVQITRHPTGVGLWRLSPDSKRIYIASADTLDPDASLRLEKKFDVRIRYASEFRKSEREIQNLKVPTLKRNKIPLKEIAEIKANTGPAFIYRNNNKRFIAIKFSLISINS